jgi:hypothetical protein
MKYRLRLLIVLTIAFLSPVIQSHPSWGIIVDGNGIVYFVEPMHNGGGTLWSYNPDSRTLNAVYKRFHAHNLTINKYGDIHAAVAIWRSGEIEGEGHNYLFKYDPQAQTLDTLIFTDDWDAFYGGDFAITTDKQNVYFPMNGALHERNLKTQKTTTLNVDIDRLCTMSFDEQDNLWITDSKHKDGTLFKWNTTDGMTEVVTNFFPEDRSTAIFDEPNHHLFFGIGFSEHGTPLLTENVQNSIWEIAPDGHKTQCYTSDSHWHPSGVYYHDCRYYVMEFGYTNRNLGPRIVILDQNFVQVEMVEIDFARGRVKNIKGKM